MRNSYADVEGFKPTPDAEPITVMIHYSYTPAEPAVGLGPEYIIMEVIDAATSEPVDVTDDTVAWLETQLAKRPRIAV